MKALLLSQYHRLEMADFPVPTPASHEVLVRVAACGTCGSDVHGYDGSSGRPIPPFLWGMKSLAPSQLPAARALPKAGADLVLTSRHRESLVPFEQEIRSLGRSAVSLELDVRDPQSIERMVEAAQAAYATSKFSSTTPVAKCASPTLDVTWDDWNLILDTNL